MIPLKDRNPTSSFPVVSITLIVLNVAVFALDRMSGHYTSVLVRTARGLVRTESFTGGLTEAFALVPANLMSSFGLYWPTIFTSMFLHGNWLHIGSNMLYLWIFGDNIEDRLGKLRFLLFYFLTGAAAAALQIVSDPFSPTPMVGASGAVAGVMGAYILLFPRAMVLTLVPVFIFLTYFDVPAFVIIGYWALLQLLNAFYLEGGGMGKGGGVAYFAHIGGFAAGMALVSTMGKRRRGFRKR